MKTYLVVLLLCCIFLLGCVKTDVSECEKISDQYDQHQCYLEKAEKAKDASVCKYLLHVPWKDECYHNVGKDTQDISTCKKIVGQETRDSCYFFVALQKNDVEICHMMAKGRYSDDCYFSLASSNSHIDLCKYLVYGDRKRWCYMEVAHSVRDFEICRRIENETFSDLCYQTISEFTSDPSGCDEMDSGWGRDYCYEKSLLYAINRDSSVCEKIERENIREACLRLVTTGQKYRVNNGTTDCNFFIFGNYYLGDVWTQSDGGTCSCTRFASFCHGGVVEIDISPSGGTSNTIASITKVTPNENTPEYKCGRIPVAYYKDVCYNLLAEDENNESICGYINNSTMRDECRASFQETSTEPIPPPETDECENNSYEERDYCYKDLAEKQRDPSFCESINDQTLQDLCYTKLANLLENRLLCVKVEQEIYGELCTSNFN